MKRILVPVRRHILRPIERRVTEPRALHALVSTRALVGLVLMATSL